MVEWSSGGCSAAIWWRLRAERWDTMARADAVAERGAVVGRTEAADAGRALRYAVAAASAAPSSCGVAAAKLRDEGRAASEGRADRAPASSPSSLPSADAGRPGACGGAHAVSAAGRERGARRAKTHPATGAMGDKTGAQNWVTTLNSAFLNCVFSTSEALPSHASVVAAKRGSSARPHTSSKSLAVRGVGICPTTRARAGRVTVAASGTYPNAEPARCVALEGGRVEATSRE
jgi:hypothetical protein